MKSSRADPFLLTVGCSFRTAPVHLRERLALDERQQTHALDELAARYGCEAIVLCTCNRVEVYLARLTETFGLDAELLAEFLNEVSRLPLESIRPLLYEHRHADAVHHLFRVAASLDSMIVGEAQIAGQVKRAYELAQRQSTVGPVLHSLFQHARIVAKRVRSETGISHGHVSVSSAAVDYVQQVFDHFGDKTILVIGAGKMGELTLRHLRQLRPRHILVTNRSPDKAETVARGCGGQALPWERLDDALAQADIILSTTGASDPVVSRQRWEHVMTRRSGGTAVILDIAVPRDFDPDIHDGDRTCLFNIDDLKRIREQTLRDRHRHIAPAEAIVEQEQKRFIAEWSRRRTGPIIARLTRELEAKRQAIVREFLEHVSDRFGEEDQAFLKEHIEIALRRFQNQVLHGPISTLSAEGHESGGHTLLEALRKLFRLED
jgi:glutamyl-tRNA reductase